MNCLTKLFQQKRRRIGYILAFSGPMISKRDSSDPENISIKEEYYYTKKNIIEEKGETQKNILPIKKNIVPLHTF